MSIFWFIYFTIFLSIFVLFLWANYLIDVVYKFRGKLIDGIYNSGKPNWRELGKDYNSVSFNTEFHTRMRFGDWRSLYPKKFRDEFPELFK